MARILVAVDDSAAAREAVLHVAALARDGLQVVAVVAHVHTGATGAASGPPGLASAERLVAAAAAMLRAAGVPHDEEVRRADGDPARTLMELAQAHRCDAIVVGAGAPGLLRHLLLGSVARTLVAESPLPVTVVRPPPAVRPPRAVRRTRDQRDGDSGWWPSWFGSGWGDADGSDGGGGDGGGGD